MRSIIRWLVPAFLFVLPASATFTLVQHPTNASCGTAVTTCAVTVSSTTTGNLGVIVISVPAATATISSISGAGIWEHLSITSGTTGNVADTVAGSADAFYAYYLTGGVTTITVTFNTATTGAQVRFLEYSHTAPGVTLEAIITKDQSSVTTTPTNTTFNGASGAVVSYFSGFSNLAIQYITTAGVVSAVAGSYTSPADFSTTFGVAGWIGVNSNVAPAWTSTSARAVLGGMSFRETPGYVPNIASFDQMPYFVQSAENFGSATLDFNEAVVLGDVLVACWGSNGQTTNPTFSDAFLDSWTIRSTETSTQPQLYCATTTAGASGTDTVKVVAATTTNQELFIAEFGNVLDSLDTQTNANFTWTSNATTMPNITTSSFRPLVLDIIFSKSNAPPISENVNATIQYTPIGASSNNQNMFVQYLVPNGNPGTITGPGMNINTSAAVGTKMVLALKSRSAVTVCTGAIPDAIQGTAYNFQMQACGGAGTNVWTTTVGALPAGLTMTSGGNITGTCTNSNSNTITFQVTDSGSVSSTANLTVKCAASAATISLAHSFDVTTACSETSQSTGFTATSGNTIVAFFSGQNTLGMPRFNDNLGTVYRVIPNVTFNSSGNNTFGIFYWGVAASTGTLSFTCDRGSQFNLITLSPGEILEFANVQNIFDTYVPSMINSTGGGSAVSNTITSPVAETLVGVSHPNTSTATIAAQAPASAIQNNLNASSKRYGVADQIGASSGSNSITWTLTTNTSNNWDAVVFGLRPSTSGLAPVAGGSRKKFLF